jgi:hypothetical protein
MGLGSPRTSISPLSFFLGFAVAFLLLGIHSSGIVDVDSIPGVASFKANSGPAASQSTGPHVDPRDSLRAAWAHVRSPGFDVEDKAPRLDSEIPPERVCVMSSDTRKMNPLGARPANFDVFSLEPYVYSVYYNLWWALRHGYKYQMVRIQATPGYDPMWTKQHAILRVLKDPACELVVYFDGDVYVTNPSYTIHELLAHWGFHSRASLLMAMDQPVHIMPQNQNATNAGFMVMRSNDKARQIIQDIIDCPERIPECAKYKLIPKHEQTAFNLFVRPNLTEGEEFIITPCTEANGNFRNQYCKGRYVTHAWHAKDTVAERASKIMVKDTFAWLESVFDGERLREWDSKEGRWITNEPEAPIRVL